MKLSTLRSAAGLFGLVLAAAAAASAGSPLSNDPSPLAVCQDTIRVAAINLASDVRRGVGACLTRGIECVAGPAELRADCCARAADRCDGDLLKVERARRRFETQIVHRRCSAVPFADVLQNLGYERLAERCAALEPPATIDTLDALVACLDRLAVAETACLIGTTELPRAAEGLACLGIEERFASAVGTELAPCGAPPEPSPSASGTPAPTSSAVVATATATPVRSATVSPSSTASPTSSPAVTVTRTATPNPTVTATVPPSAAATATPVPTVTATIATGTASATPTPVRTATSTPATTATATPIASITPAATTTTAATTTANPTATASGTPQRTATTTPPPTATATVTATRTVTPVTTVTATPIPTTTATRTATPVATTTATRTATPVPTTTATPTGPVCGNGTKEAGEDCDDGNTFDCDACPSNCRTAPADCATGTTRAPQTVRLVPPAGQALTSSLICLRYPAGTVGLPGTGLVTMRSSGFAGTVSVNDFNNAATIGMLGRTALSEVNVTLSFDLCNGATAPPPTAFACRVVSASNAGASVNPASVQCDPVAAP